MITMGEVLTQTREQDILQVYGRFMKTRQIGDGIVQEREDISEK